MPERKYAMIRVQAGVYLLPSNDLKTLWRISSYEEEGNLYDDDKPVKGTFWETAKRPMPKYGYEIEVGLEYNFLWGEGWSVRTAGHRTRREAIEEALNAPDR